MQTFTVIFAHGKESGPWGVKIRTLARVAEKFGCQVISRDDRDTFDPELRVDRLVQECSSLQGGLILVGSSMGGYVTTVASRTVRPLGLFLMAPALGLPGYAEPAPHPACGELTVVHGWDDDVVPSDAVYAFCSDHHATLHMIPASHALLEQVDLVGVLFRHFLARCLDVDDRDTTEHIVATF